MDSTVESIWLPVGEEPQAAGSITHCTIMRNQGIASVSLPSGDIDAASEPACGIYHRDTRYISRLEFSLGGLKPMLLDARQTDSALTAVFTNQAIRRPSGSILPARSLMVRRRRVLDESVFETVTISNYSREIIEVDFRWHVEADFRDIFEVRGYERRGVMPLVNADIQASKATIRFSSTGSDATYRHAAVRFFGDPHEVYNDGAILRLTLEPQETRELSVEMSLQRESANLSASGAVERVRQRQQDWLSGGTTIETDNEQLNAALDRALLDILALQSEINGNQFTAAGVPWFDTLFGRDSLIAGIQLLAIRPEVLRSALLVLAQYQATETDAARDAEPGKIPHELRWGELANANEVPFGRYYGSVDSTPLFIIAAGEYFAWTDDVTSLRSLWPALCRAYEWCRKRSEDGPSPFLTYARTSSNGLEHQGWKDSHDGIPWPDGRDVEAPVALVEVQGYLVAALTAFARLAEQFQPEHVAGTLALRDDVHREMEKAFGHPAIGYVLALDGSGRQVPTLASNAGHLLWAGVASDEAAGEVVRWLMAPETFSGWGIRTLSSSMGSFNPLGYHTGTVWPHDTALALAGLRRYGFDEAAERLGSSLLQLAMLSSDLQVPELLSGDARDFRLVPTPYPVSSRPQAWAAGSVLYTVVTLLGIRPLSPNQISLTRPLLPHGLNWVCVKNLRRGSGAVDLTFTRSNGKPAVRVDSMRGEIAVVLTDSGA
ncbi:hypothetical protein AYO38_08210 [bacterium SCGC AG-212-C10]|nr:hypothetical protein AYO38_08210 [bacterium SCGC AG-212-C10]